MTTPRDALRALENRLLIHASVLRLMNGAIKCVEKRDEPDYSGFPSNEFKVTLP